MSITRTEQVACGCGAPVEIDLCDSLNAERHPHLRERVMHRRLHTAICVACARVTIVEHQFLYVDLARRQVLGVFARADRDDADDRAREVEAMFERWFRGDAPRWMRELAERCLVRACFGLEELREKLVADEAGLDDLALEALKCVVLAGDPGFRDVGAATLRLDRVERDLLELVAVDADDLPCGAEVQVARAELARLPRGAALLAAYPGIAAGPHVSMLRLAR
jgi:hypothetical protein